MKSIKLILLSFMAAAMLTSCGMNNTNDNPGEHGYGLISVQTSLEKYNGKLQNDIIDNKYIAKAILYNIKQKEK